MSVSSQNKAIFDKIGELLHTSEFTDAQVQFFEQNCKLFSEDQEENKHEYKTIHEGYIYLVDQAIEAKIQEEFGEEAVNEFYTDFMENYSSYKQIHEETVNILKSAIDFEKFKAHMYEVKKDKEME